MSQLVVDASVALKWLFPEQWSDQALQIPTLGHELIAPDWLHVEIANAAWKRSQRRVISATDAAEAVEQAELAPVRSIPSVSLISEALKIAFAYNRSIYDSLYIALAQREACQFVTADLRLYNALKDPLPERMLWIGDI